jgi:hypothetical protein
LKVLEDLVKEGYSIGDIPVVDVEAETKEEAGKILLAISSKYQNVTKKGLYDFMQTMDISIEDLKMFEFSELDMKKFEAEYFEKDKSIEPELLITSKLYESYNYVLIYTDNKIDETYLEEFFNLQPHKSYKNRRIGITRVVSFKDFLDALRRRGLSK